MRAMQMMSGLPFNGVAKLAMGLATELAAAPAVAAMVVIMALPAAAAQPATSAAAAFPARPLRMLIGYPPGGTSDYVARVMAQKISDYTGQPMPVDNRPAANGTIAAQTVAHAAPDGHTVWFGTSGSTSIAAALLGPRLSFDPFRDFAPIILLVHSTQLIVVNPSLNVHSIQELVKLAKARPGELSFGSTGVGTPNHLGMELLKYMAGIDLNHVPYKGSSQMAVDLTSGRVQVALNSMIAIMPYVKSGKLVPIAVGSAQRSPAMPEVPTVAESGYPDYVVSTWYGLYVPAGTPRGIINTLNALSNKALAEPQVARSLSSQGAEPAGGPPEELARTMRSEYERWHKMIVATKLKVD